jgi:hypothetical protein
MGEMCCSQEGVGCVLGEEQTWRTEETLRNGWYHIQNERREQSVTGYMSGLLILEGVIRLKNVLLQIDEMTDKLSTILLMNFNNYSFPPNKGYRMY